MSDIEEPEVRRRANDPLTAAKRARNDEFYTRYEDVEREVQAYVDHALTQFEGMVVLCPTDGPDSAFTRYFTGNRERLGLRAVICTQHRPGERGWFLRIDDLGVVEGWLEGDGDFRSDEVTALRNEADMVITNPPFSLFREFLAWVLA